MSSAPTSTDPSSLEVPQWLKTLPLAPEYHPTLAEFEDPIGYILKIEKEASRYGICKIVPPLPGPPRKTALLNLNRSFAARNSAADGGSKKAPSTFTTRQQQLGFCPRRPRPVQKPVWQSGENYTLQQFENKAKQFEKVQLKRHGRKGNCSFSELEVETLFWRAAVDKPIVVEYANDMPGSGFAPMRLAGTRKLREEDSANVGDTAWNMRGVSRAKGSLLKFMEEIPGVTSPMVYVAMMYSWFAWHVEDHELHSLNYLHMGAGKTWYGVPRDAALAFEEVIRTQGYGGDVNPLVTFMILVEKTTVMSPEVLVGAGIPCCRLVQNAGDFVVTFPGAYHCGFSHGFNCGEAANISTPEWLSVAKEAAVRRASINYPPMLSHFQLLYELALSLWCRKPMNSVNEPRSSRLKDKMKGEGEVMIKKFFVENVIQNNDLLYSLVDMGSLCVVLPRNKFDVAFNFNSRMRSQMKIKAKPALGLSGQEEALEATSDMLSDDHMTDRNSVSDDVSPFSREQSPVPEHHQKTFTSFKGGKSGQADQDSDIDSMNVENGSANKHKVDMLLDQGLLSCVTCGILSFACVAIVRPTDAAAMHLMSSDCSSFSGPSVALESVSGTENDRYLKNMEPTESGTMKKNDCHGFNDKLLHSSSDRLYIADQHNNQVSKPAVQSGGSALDLLASVYGNDSDLEDEGPTLCANESVTEQPSSESLPEHPQQLHDPTSSQSPQDLQALGSESLSGDVWMSRHPSSKPVCDNNSADECGVSDTRVKECQQVLKFYSRKHTKNNNKPVAEDVKLNGDGAEPLGGSGKSSKSSVSERTFKDSYKSCWDLDTREDCQGSKEERSEYRRGRSPSPPNSICDSGTKISNHGHPTTQYKNKFRSRDESACVPSIQRPDKDSSRMHVFCLEHALDVQKQLLPVGGVNMMLLCHPDYEAIESQAKSMADELAIDYTWKDIHFREATEEDQELIQSALADEEAVPVNSDWAVKMGINLYYSVTLSKSPLYSKQLPYNAVIYKAFGRTSTGESPGKQKVYERKRGRKKKLVVSGRWCGKVWMSNQVHPYMAYKDDSEEEELEEADYQQLEVDSENEQLTGNESSDVAPEPVKKSTGKRKKSSRESSAKKPKHVRREAKRILQEEEEFSDDSIGECLRALKSERRKYPSTPELRHYDKAVRSARVLDDDSEEGPSSRPRKPIKSKVTDTQKSLSEKQVPKKAKKAPGRSSITKAEIEEYVCDMEGCTMSFSTKHDLVLHKRNICPVKGCGKKFFSHKYLVQHRKVHMDDRPLKCPWKGCNMSFKWAWARTEHIRVHTGDRPYICTAGGCGQTFRFVSDFSRHKRKTGHVSKKGYR